MDNQLKRIMDLVRRTGDRFIVADPDGNNAYVVMDLNQYEAMVDLEAGAFDEPDLDESFDLPDEFLVPPSSPATAPPPPPAVPEDHPEIWDVMPPADRPAPTWDPARLTEEEKQDLNRQYQEFKSPPPAASSEPQKIAEESQKTPVEPSKKDDFGEEQFYLEPIE